MQKHGERDRLANLSSYRRIRWAGYGSLLMLSLLILVISMGCDSGPAPSSPVAATSPNPITPDSGTVRSVPTSAPSVTAPEAVVPLPTTPAPATSPATPVAPATLTPITTGGVPTSSPAPPIPTLVDSEAVIVYSLIAHDLVTQSQTDALTQTVPSYIGVNPRAGRGSFLDTDSATASIPDGFIDNMADLGTTVTFSAFADAVPDLENGAPVRDEGIYLTLGEIQPQGDAGHVTVYASFYRKMDDATGYRYIMEHSGDGPWVIKDRHQVWDR